ncbi:MAG: hypothetical protein ACR2OZ_00545 [Verrucomicrobiales bacterium]
MILQSGEQIAGRNRWLARAGLALLFVASAAAKNDEPLEVDLPAKVKPGATGLVKPAGKGLRYFLRVPKKYDARDGARLIVFLHGSNTNGLDYLRSFESKRWCDEDVLCCPNGESGTDPFGQNNFGLGSAPLVAAVTEEVQKAFKPTITYIGGHSQGGFLTYSVILNFPHLYRGAFPMAADCWSQSLSLASKWAKDGEWGWVWNTATTSKSGGRRPLTSADEAAKKAIPAITEALKGKPADWVPKWVEFWRVYGSTGTAKPIVEKYLNKRDQQRSAAARLFQESQLLFRSDKRDEAFKVLERLRDEGPCTYQAYFACKWLAERK